MAGADPKGRAGQSTPNATQLIKVACEATAGLRDGVTVFGEDYDTPDGTCIRDLLGWRPDHDDLCEIVANALG